MHICSCFALRVAIRTLLALVQQAMLVRLLSISKVFIASTVDTEIVQSYTSHDIAA